MPYFEISTRTIVLRTSSSPSERIRTPVLEIWTNSAHAHRLSDLLAHAKLQKQQFGVFLPSTFRFEAPSSYHRHVQSHHQHLQQLRLVVVYGIPEAIMHQRVTHSGNAPSTLYQHLCSVPVDTANSTSPDLFAHIEKTNNTEETGKWFFITNMATHSQALTFIDNQLPDLVNQDNSKRSANRSMNSPPRPHRSNRPSQTIRTYSETLKAAISSERMHQQDSPSDQAQTSCKTSSITTDTVQHPTTTPLPPQNNHSNPTHAPVSATNTKKNNSLPSPESKTEFQKIQQLLNEVTTQLRAHEDLITTIKTQVQVQKDLIDKLTLLLETQQRKQQVFQHSLEHITRNSQQVNTHDSLNTPTESLANSKNQTFQCNNTVANSSAMDCTKPTKHIKDTLPNTPKVSTQAKCNPQNSSPRYFYNYPRVITAESGSSPNSQTSRKEASSNQQYTQPSYSHNNQDETVDYSIAMSLAHEKDKD